MLLDRVTNSAQERRELLNRVADQPVVMGWDAIADHIVRHELADVVPDPAHQQAARAELASRMAIAEWEAIGPNGGEMVGKLTIERLNKAIASIREHYQQTPSEPYPARVPNPMAEITVEAQGERQRAYTRGDRSDPMRLLSGTAPARGATQTKPDLGDGARGVGVAGVSRGTPERSR